MNKYQQFGLGKNNTESFKDSANQWRPGEKKNTEYSGADQLKSFLPPKKTKQKKTTNKQTNKQTNNFDISLPLNLVQL